MSQGHVWFCRKPDGDNPKQSETIENGIDGWYQVLGEVCTWRGIFHGDSLSPLQIVLALHDPTNTGVEES